MPGFTVLVCAFRYWSGTSDYEAASEKAGEPSFSAKASKGRGPAKLLSSEADPAAYLRGTGREPRPEFIAGAKALGLKPKLSRYALGPDYHEVLKGKLGSMLADITEAHAGVQGKAFADTSPVLEKELGRLAGLGFRGKNTLLISEELGSYFFIGGLALSLELRPEELSVPHGANGLVGSGKCAAACPTARSASRASWTRALSFLLDHPVKDRGA